MEVVNAVAKEAKELIKSSSVQEVDAARELFQKRIFEWTEGCDGGDKEELLLELWIKFAEMEIELRQFKQAIKVFESAVVCPIVGVRSKIWTKYAEFCENRKKLSNSRKVFIRAIPIVKNEEVESIWQSFLTFAVKHIDASLTIATLKETILPTIESPATTTTQSEAKNEKINSIKNTPPTVFDGRTSNSESNSAEEKNTDQDQSIQPVEAHSEQTKNTLAPVQFSPLSDEETGTKLDNSKKRDFAHCQSDGDDLWKNKKSKAIESSIVQPPLPPAPAPGYSPITSVTSYFYEIPSSLPPLPKCPHLLFDILHDKEEHVPLGDEIVERLSTVLTNGNVFIGIRDMCQLQRKKDKDTLYRWQDLITMQLKEGSEMFLRHKRESKQFMNENPAESLDIIHKQQREQFAFRCQLSQQQFIEITESDRQEVLKAQQLSLQNLQFPEVTVTLDFQAVSLQRAIVAVVLEADDFESSHIAEPAASFSNSPQKSQPTFRSHQSPQHQTLRYISPMVASPAQQYVTSTNPPPPPLVPHQNDSQSSTGQFNRRDPRKRRQQTQLSDRSTAIFPNPLPHHHQQQQPTPFFQNPPGNMKYITNPNVPNNSENVGGNSITSQQYANNNNNQLQPAFRGGNDFMNNDRSGAGSFNIARRNNFARR